MTYRNLLWSLSFAIGLILGGQNASSASFIEAFQASLYAGRTADAEAAAKARLAEASGDAQARFALGAVQFLSAVERLGQDLHGYGLSNSFTDPTGLSGLPFLRLPVPGNADPEPVTYEALKSVLRDFAGGLSEAEATLAAVPDGPVDLPLNIGLIRLDLDGDDMASDEEALWKVFQRVGGFNWLNPVEAAKLQADFDASDVPWLRGYCHLLMAMAEFLLAHDWEDAFDATFHNVFPKSDLGSSALLKYQGQSPEQHYMAGIADLIAFVHLNHWPVVEPDRMQAALIHLEAMVALSRENWRRIMAETDNHNEWIPNPAQNGVLPGMQVTDERVAGWQEFLNEFEALLQGRKLLPHFRFERGINLRRMFTQPRTFDIVLLIQGTAALPYLEDGELTSSQTWNGIVRLLGGDFFRYFIWFN